MSPELFRLRDRDPDREPDRLPRPSDPRAHWLLDGRNGGTTCTCYRGVNHTDPELDDPNDHDPNGHDPNGIPPVNALLDLDAALGHPVTGLDVATDPPAQVWLALLHKVWTQRREHDEAHALLTRYTDQLRAHGIAPGLEWPR